MPSGNVCLHWKVVFGPEHEKPYKWTVFRPPGPRAELKAHASRQVSEVLHLERGMGMAMDASGGLMPAHLEGVGRPALGLKGLPCVKSTDVF